MCSSDLTFVLLTQNMLKPLKAKRLISEIPNGFATFTSVMLANERQRNCAKRALHALEEAEQAHVLGITLDAVGVEIQSALEALMELTGEQASEAVIDEVFSQFCVGK